MDAIDPSDCLDLHPRMEASAPGRETLSAAARYARTLHATVERRSAEARALAGWMAENAARLRLPPELEEACELHQRVGGMAAAGWKRAGGFLQRAMTGRSTEGGDAGALWGATVGRQLGFDRLEADILTLALQYRVYRQVERLWDMVSIARGGPPQLTRDARLFALLLGADAAEIEQRLNEGARLLGSGVLVRGAYNRLAVLERLQHLVSREVAPAADIYDQLMGTTRAAPLAWDAFAHLGREAEIAAQMLAAALDRREPGVNILLYGPPGTGKTSFAATLAERVGRRLRGVAETDGEGDEPDREQRLAGLRLAQRLAEPGRTVLLFDEAEDLFAASRFGRGGAAGSRVFIHRLLERTRVPVIWIANDIDALGPAVLRRMTMCLELRIPDLGVRTTLWQRLGEEHGVKLTEPEAARLARLVPAAPAVAASALRAARLADATAETAQLIVQGVARAVRGGLPAPAPEPEPDAGYDPALVSADADLAALEASLLWPGAPRQVSFLVSGPPGTGKTAWIRHLARRIGLAVLQKRASDLLDPFVGGTEQKIAAAFAEARQAGAFLVFDEADSLLLDRAEAMRGWEISQVNEMLTWMESHPLPFACTTNLAERLDRASLRRFLVKLRFGWLRPAQARLAFRRFFGQPAPEALDALHTLTPADFALVRRRAALAEAGGVELLLRLLAAECEGRVGRAPVGFLPPGPG